MRQRGFTLAEILVTTAIFAVIMIAALTVYDRSNRVFKNATEAADLQQSTRIAFDKLVSDLRMAGFDYSRGGIPTGNGQFAQPDEQVEYAGPTAVVFRANFDYNTDVASGNGLEPTYTVNNTGGSNVFPYVTTANDEIVAYALRSTGPNAATANVETISFWIDSSVPRRAYPNVAGLTSGGTAETQISLGTATCTGCGVDTTNTNPPYTLYRITLDDILNNRMGTPVAENIRSMQLRYYTDGKGATLLTEPDPTVPITTGRNADGTTFDATNTGAIGGAGRYDPASVGTAANYDDRQQRALIQSVRLDLVGMNASPEANYQNPTETNTSFKTYRQFALSSLIVPRNLGKQGFPEPAYNPPGPPEITGACTGHCAAPFIQWNAPSGGGPVYSYEIQYDTDPNGAFASTIPISDPSARSAIIQDNGVSDPSQLIYYRIVALNDNGQSQPSANYAITPQNRTKPNAPAALAGTNNQSNQITLTFTSPSTNATTAMSCTGASSVTGATIPSQEIIRFQIYRSIDPNFNPNAGEGVMVLDYGTASQPTGASPGATITWIDKGKATPSDPVQSLEAPAACVQYYYRVRAMDRCSQNPAHNLSGAAADSISDWFPAVGSPAQGGIATGGSTPSDPNGLVIDTATTACPFAGNLCKIGLHWNKTTTDTTGAGVGVDTYIIQRERRIQGDPTFLLDVTYGTGGYNTVSGFSATSGATAAYVDNTALYQDIIGGAGLWEYRYSVASKICTTASAGYSNTAIYPGCPAAFSVTSSAAIGSGASGSPWTMGYGDALTLTATAGTIATTTFQIKNSTGTTNVGSASTVAGSPASFAWGNLTDGVTYSLWMVVTDSTGCVQTVVRYITQESAAACTFQDIGTTGRPGTPPGTNVAGGGPQRRLAQIDFVHSTTSANNYSATNNQTTETMRMNILSASPGGPFNASATITWADIKGEHEDLLFDSVDWSKVNAAGTTTFAAVNVPVNVEIPDTVLALPATVGATTITVVSTATFGAIGSTGTLYCGTEAMNYTITSLTVFTVTRGALGTTAAAHVTASIVDKMMTTVVAAPGAFPDVAVNESIRLNFRFRYDTRNGTALPGTALKKVCIKYKVDGDLSRTQSCNLVGRIVTTANPTSCD
jgi:prepilin-type N-terminal cleavage/methylation domain-containing protein